MDSPKRMTGYSSPCDSGSSSYETEGSVKMNEQIRRSIQKMKVAIVRKSSELASSTSRSRLSSKRKSKTEKEVRNILLYHYLKVYKVSKTGKTCSTTKYFKEFGFNLIEICTLRTI